MDFNQLRTIPTGISSTIALHPASLSTPRYAKSYFYLFKKLMIAGLNIKGVYKMFIHTNLEMESSIKSIWKEIIKQWGSSNTQ